MTPAQFQRLIDEVAQTNRVIHKHLAAIVASIFALAVWATFFGCVAIVRMFM